MSIILIDKKSLLSKQISIGSQFLNTPILKKLASTQLNCHYSELRLYHMGTEKQFGENEIVKQGEKIQYAILAKIDNLSSIENRKKGIIYPDQLQKIIQNSKIIVIKSANQQNIQKSKDHSLWATTFSNQDRLKYFFHNFPNVILMFATNRSYEIKGLARMESEPEKITDKSVWAGVSNIRLGGNFKIKWLRKKPLSLVTVEKNLGANFRESIIKSCDGQELDPLSCKRLANLFETPSDPYYPIEEVKFSNSAKEFEASKTVKLSLPTFPIFGEMKIPPLPQVQSPKISMLESIPAFQKQKSQHFLESQPESVSKDKKIKKQRKKKSKKHKKEKKSHKKHQRSSSGSESSSAYSSDQSSDSEERRKRNKRNKRTQKHKKPKKHRF